MTASLCWNFTAYTLITDLKEVDVGGVFRVFVGIRAAIVIPALILISPLLSLIISLIKVGALVLL